MPENPIECFVCGSKGFSVGPKPPFQALTSLRFADLFRCETCRAEFWWPMDNVLDEKVSWDIDPSICDVFEERHARALKFLKQHLPAGSRVLDVGCRGAAFSACARDIGMEAYGVDLEPEIIRIAKEYHHLQNLFSGNFLELAPRWKNEKFDAIAFFEVFEHVDHPRAILQAAASIMKPGGYLVFTVPNIEAKEPSTGVAPYQWTRYSGNTVRQFLERNDFAVEKLAYVEPSLPQLKQLLFPPRASALAHHAPVGLGEKNKGPAVRKLSYLKGGEFAVRKIVRALARAFLFPVVLARRTPTILAIGRYRG